MFKMIVNADKNWGIGLKNELLIRIPNDMKFFRAHTLNNVVICGRHTLESFPGQRPLPDRTTIVMSRNPKYSVPKAEIAHNIDELLKMVENYPDQEIYVIGGERVYRDLLPYCDTAYVTRVDMEYEADAFFPNLEADPEWEMVDESEEETYYDVIYHYTTWKRKK